MGKFDVRLRYNSRMFKTRVVATISGLILSLSLAFAQVDSVTVVGTTVQGLDAIAFSGSTLYGTTAGSIHSGSLYTINTSTGAGTLVGALVGASNSALKYAITGLAFQPGTGTLFGATSKNSTNSANSLVTVNPATGAVTVIGPFNIGSQQGPADLTFTPGGTLYGWIEGDLDQLATINLSTGQATSVGPSGISTFGSGIASNSSGVLYYAGFGTGGALDTVNASTGAPTKIATLGSGNTSGDSVAALAFSPGGVLFGIEGGDTTTALITIALTVTPPAPTPAPTTWILAALGLACIGLYQKRTTLLALFHRA
jgi:hypothetical protein